MNMVWCDFFKEDLHGSRKPDRDSTTVINKCPFLAFFFLPFPPLQNKVFCVQVEMKYTFESGG